MHVAFDDTDSVDGMCTTFLATEVIARSGLDVIGYPRLVRLNPNIGFKTRGNGAVVMHLGKGAGRRFPIGEISGSSIFGYEREVDRQDQEKVLELVSALIEEYAVMEDPKTNPGVVISDSILDEKLYLEALRKELSPEGIEKELRRLGLHYRKFKNGQGIVGSTAALGWRGNRKTYEIIAYDYPRPEAQDSKLQMEAATFVDGMYHETFNNVDVRNRDAAIFPSNRTPVLYGVRSVYPERLPEVSKVLSERFGVDAPAKLIYESNQGTDDHIVHSPDRLWETGSFAIKGEVAQIPAPIRGGHYFTMMNYGGTEVKLAAFEPTKEFRNYFRELRPGDIIEAMGSFVDSTLNVEKMRVLFTSRFFRRVPPVCTSCGKQMKNHGRNDYRCKSCSNVSSTPGYIEEERNIAPGEYEVPVTARRHLSMPFRIEPHFRNPRPDMVEGSRA